MKTILLILQPHLPGANELKGLTEKSALVTSQWRHNERDGIPITSHTQPFIQGVNQRKHQSSASLWHWPLRGEFTGEFPAQRASNTEKVSIWWRHHEIMPCSRFLSSHRSQAPIYQQPQYWSSFSKMFSSRSRLTSNCRPLLRTQG